MSLFNSACTVVMTAWAGLVFIIPSLVVLSEDDLSISTASLAVVVMGTGTQLVISSMAASYVVERLTNPVKLEEAVVVEGTMAPEEHEISL